MAVTINTLREYKQKGEAFSALTSYDATFAQVVSEAGVDVILIGDSLGMVLQGHDSTLPVTMDQMVYHTSCVARGNKGALIMADMPFMSYGTVADALDNAAELMRAGAHMVKLEGTDWMKDTIEALSERGVPVCAHLGLTPQFVNKFGGYKVQGRDEKAAEAMIEHACELEAAGADIILGHGLLEVLQEIGAKNLGGISKGTRLPRNHSICIDTVMQFGNSRKNLSFQLIV